MILVDQGLADRIWTVTVKIYYGYPEHSSSLHSAVSSLSVSLCVSVWFEAIRPLSLRPAGEMVIIGSLPDNIKTSCRRCNLNPVCSASVKGSQGKNLTVMCTDVMCGRQGWRSLIGTCWKLLFYVFLCRTPWLKACSHKAEDFFVKIVPFKIQ